MKSPTKPIVLFSILIIFSNLLLSQNYQETNNHSNLPIDLGILFIFSIILFIKILFINHLNIFLKNNSQNLEINKNYFNWALLIPIIGFGYMYRISGEIDSMLSKIRNKTYSRYRTVWKISLLLGFVYLGIQGSSQNSNNENYFNVFFIILIFRLIFGIILWLDVRKYTGK